MRRFLFCLALALCTLSAAPMTRLTILVKNTEGKPVERASVIVKFIHGHNVLKLGRGTRTEWELQTNQEGRISIPPIPQGAIRVQVIAKNYQTFGDDFDVDQEQQTIDIKLNRPQGQYSAH
jgi:uncharacterized GH25 family protein